VVRGRGRVEGGFSGRAGAIETGKIIPIEPGDETVVEINGELKVKRWIDGRRNVKRFAHRDRRVTALHVIEQRAAERRLSSVVGVTETAIAT